MTNKKIGKNIRIIREMKNISRDFVASELCMTTSGYGKIERDEIDLTLSKIIKLSEIFEISLIDLLFFDVTSFFSETTNQKMEVETNNIHISKVHNYEIEK